LAANVPERVDLAAPVALDVASGTDVVVVARSPLELFWRRLRRDRVALAALVFIVLLIVMAVFAPLVAKLVGARPPDAQSTSFLTVDGTPTGPSADALFGTDPLGRDVFSRTVYGARTSLEVALIATAVTMTLGVAFGMVAAYYRGWVDTLLARTMDVMLAFPVLLLAIGLGAACSIGKGCLTVDLRLAGVLLIGCGAVAAAVQTASFLLRRRRAAATRPPYARELALRCASGGVLALLGLACLTVLPHDGTLIQPGVPVLVFVLALGGTPYVARIIRGQTLSLREREFVEAAQALGASDSRVLLRHVLPNLVAPILVYTTLLIPANILFEAALSFLGVGVQPPTSSWGAMISDAVATFDTAWWYMTFPGLALILTVLAFNLVGDGLQDALSQWRGS
jgi:peptide/nickel transport system permease protein